MKFNVDIELDFLEESEGNLSLEQAIKKEIIREVSQNVAKEIKESFIKETSKDDFLKETKKCYDEEIQKLKNIPRELSNDVKVQIGECFDAFLKRKAVKIYDYGAVKEETTIEALIAEKMSDYHKNYRKVMEELINKEINKAKLTDYGLEDFVKNEVMKISKENARKVTDFLVNGLKAS